MPQTEYAIQLEHVTKTFGPVIANHDVTMNIRRGEILSLLGENGSGKTTLMNMISGIYFPDGGTIYVNGQEVMIRSPKDAFDLGIGMIHQHFKLVDVLTAAENVALGLKEPGRYDIKKVAAKVKAIGDKYGFRIDPNKKIYEMSVSEKQTVEIIKVLYRGADILILDEPTVGLNPKQIIEVRSLIHNLAKEHTVILSSHILSEVQAVCDQIIILHHGKLLANDTPEGLEEQLGGRRLLLTAKGDKGQVERILSQTPGVQSAEVTQDGELTHGTLQLEGEDPREALFFAFAQAGLPLLDFHLDETSLEQIFLGLTQEQPQAPAKPSRLRWRRKATEPVAVVSVDEGKEVPDESDL